MPCGPYYPTFRTKAKVFTCTPVVQLFRYPVFIRNRTRPDAQRIGWPRRTSRLGTITVLTGQRRLADAIGEVLALAGEGAVDPLIVQDRVKPQPFTNVFIKSPKDSPENP